MLICIPIPQANLVDDLVTLDPELHRNLMSLRRMSSTAIEGLGLVLAVSEEASAAPAPLSSSAAASIMDQTPASSQVEVSSTRVVTVPLVPGGENIPVTSANLSRYIQLVANYRLNTQISAQCRAFLRGFRSLIPLSWMRMFGPAELQVGPGR